MSNCIQTHESVSVAGKQPLRFGQMYEDSKIEREAFAKSKRVFCIASGGCTLFALLNLCQVVACDVNRAQLAYIERRLRGAKEEAGITERVLRLARIFAPAIGWRESSLKFFLALTDTTKQLRYWDTVLDTHRFRSLFDTVMAIRALTAKHLVRMRPAAFGPLIRQRLRRGFQAHPNATNPYMYAVLLGKGKQIEIPKSIHTVSLIHADAARYLESCAPGSFDGFTFSNILDGTNRLYRQRLVDSVRRAGTSDATIVFRSFYEYALDSQNDFTLSDRALMWGTVFVGKHSDLTTLKGLL